MKYIDRDSFKIIPNASDYLPIGNILGRVSLTLKGKTVEGLCQKFGSGTIRIEGIFIYGRGKQKRKEEIVIIQEGECGDYFECAWINEGKFISLKMIEFPQVENIEESSK